MDVITYLCWDESQSMLVKKMAPGVSMHNNGRYWNWKAIISWTLRLLAVPGIVLTTISGVINDDKVGIITIIGFHRRGMNQYTSD